LHFQAERHREGKDQWGGGEFQGPLTFL
jgi:hypothetical protein